MALKYSRYISIQFRLQFFSNEIELGHCQYVPMSFRDKVQGNNCEKFERESRFVT